MPGVAEAAVSAVPLATSMLPRPFAVRAVRRETHDTFTLELEPADAGPPVAFAAGQFTMLYAFGVGEAAISISGDPAAADAALVHTIRRVGSVTRALGRLRPGDAVGVRGPYGVPWPLAEAVGHDVVLVAGGIGLAPLRPLIHEIVAHRERFGRAVLLYGARTPRDILFARQLRRWRGSLSFDVHVTVDRGDQRWRGDVGVVTQLIGRAPFDPANTVAMVCGPEIMMRFTAQELLRRGLRPSAIRVSLERNMKCAIGSCGHCQFGPLFVCKDGPVFRYDRVAGLLGVREV